MTIGDWASVITAAAVFLGGGGILMVPRLRKHLAAQTDQIETDRQVARQGLDLQIFKESLVEAHARIERLTHRADEAERKLVEAETRHRIESERARNEIADLVLENRRQKQEIETLRSEVERLRRLAGEHL